MFQVSNTPLLEPHCLSNFQPSIVQSNFYLSPTFEKIPIERIFGTNEEVNTAENSFHMQDMHFDYRDFQNV